MWDLDRAASLASWLARWCLRHRRWLAGWAVLTAVTWLGGAGSFALIMMLFGLAPGLFASVWAALSPGSYDSVIASPSRRFGWWWFARRRWQATARVCGLSDRQVAGQTQTRNGRPVEVSRWVAPKLRRVHTTRHAVELTIRARPGQRLCDLEAGVERLATTFAAVAHRVWPVTGSGSGCTVVAQLVMRDSLTRAATATTPDEAVLDLDAVRLGRTQGGQEWRLALRGRHTLVAGCSGSGKGSVLWGICGGLAPAVKVDVVRLWGIDLKRGVELAMGEALFSTRGYTPTAALDVLRALMRVIDARGEVMAGTTRLHAPLPGDPLHVLVIDELAALTAYADLDVRREAGRLLAEVLTQGRALGVVVVACVQDPRKEVVTMRGLFTQTVALRLRSADETVMVLGDGTSQVAPAHRISPAHPGTAWVVEDTGTVDRVRADFWPDPLIRQVAARHPSPVQVETDQAVSSEPGETWATKAPQDSVDSVGSVGLHAVPPSRPRSARKPRAPRAPRAPRDAAEFAHVVVDGPEQAS